MLFYFKNKIFYIIINLLFLNLISFIKSYDTSLLKVNYFVDNKNLYYINAFSNSKGDLYIEYFGINSKTRYFYRLNSTTGKEILFKNNKILKILFGYDSIYHESIIINYQNEENYIFTISPEYFEFIYLNTGKYGCEKSNNIIANDILKSSYKNKIIQLKNNNYLLSMVRYPLLGYNLVLYTFKFESNSINGFKKINEKFEVVDYLNITDCFQTEEGYIECLYNSIIHLVDSFRISFYDSNLKYINYQVLANIKDNSFIKIFHLKKEIGIYIYFERASSIPYMQIKYLENYKLKDQFEKNENIALNGEGKYTLSTEILLSDGIKINDNKFTIIFTSKNLQYILICLFDIYNNDKSLYLRYFYLNLENINIKLSMNIKAFLFRDQIGITFYNSLNQYPGYIIFNYPNITKEESLELILFKENNKIYNFSLFNNIEILNNIFIYELIKIKIINFKNFNESNVLLFSYNTNNTLKINEELYINDKIIFKKNDDDNNKQGIYTLELLPIIKEPEYNKFNSIVDKTFNIGNEFKDFYIPQTINGKIIKVLYIIESNCDYAFHKDIYTREKKCYRNINHCLYEEYKYYIDDTKECRNNGCPNGYYQFNFMCYKEECPYGATLLSSDSYICISNNDFYIINEYYQNEYDINKKEEYIYNFNNTKQYLKSCNDSLNYTTSETETYLYNKTCWIKCPENTIEDIDKKICICKFYMYQKNDYYICYSEEEKCKDKIEVIDIKKCEDTIDNCINKNYKIFNNECYALGCPNNTKIDENENYKCKCLNLYYTDYLNNKKICILNNDYCIEGYPYEDILTKECMNYCSINKIINKECIINNDIYGNDIKNITENLKDLVYNINNTNQDIIINGNNIIYEITTSENNNYYDNISYIDFGVCEQKLKDYYGLDFFTILKYDIKYNVSITSSVEYELYNSLKKSKLNLSICQNDKINIYLALDVDNNTKAQYEKLSKLNINIFNKTDKFYNDICFTFSSDDNTDMILKDRREIYYKDYSEYCEEGCEYIGYNFTIKRVICFCFIKKKINYEIKKIGFNKSNLDSYLNIATYANFAILKCISLTFTIEGQKYNYGSYLFIILNLSYIALMIIFYHNYGIKIKDILNFALKGRTHIDYPPKKTNISNNKIKLDSGISLKSSKIDNDILNTMNIEENIKKDDKDKNKEINKDNSAREMKDSNKTQIDNNKILIKDIINNEKKCKYNDEELNALTYEEALKYDKRSYIQYYVSLLKKKHLILFTFFRKNDFNLISIKIGLFIFSFSLYFVINALFFTDKTMHKIYEDKGIFNIIVQIPNILYSTIISVIINLIMKTLSLSEDDILKIRKNKTINLNKINEEVKKVYSCLKIKMNIFCIISLLFMIFFWYYVSCFFSVYKNTKIILLKDTFISFGTSMIYPIFLNLLPGIFRIPSLNKESKRKCLYNFSKIVALI